MQSNALKRTEILFYQLICYLTTHKSNLTIYLHIIWEFKERISKVVTTKMCVYYTFSPSKMEYFFLKLHGMAYNLQKNWAPRPYRINFVGRHETEEKLN